LNSIEPAGAPFSRTNLGNKILNGGPRSMNKDNNLGARPRPMIWRMLVILTMCAFAEGFISCGQASGHASVKKDLNFQPIKSLAPDTAMLSSEERRKAWQLDTLFLAKVKKTHFNGNVLIAQHGKVLYEKCFGYEDFKQKKKLGTCSAFQLASSSKPMTAAAIMILKERGKVGYDDLIQKFIPQFPYQGITVRMLLNHRSGLPNYEYFMGGYVADHDTPLSTEKVLDLMIANKPALYSKPDKHFSYNNSNYMILAMIIEKASGTDYRSFLQREIFEPCGMSCTYIPNRKSDTLRPNETRNYMGGGAQLWTLARFNFLDGVLGDKGIYSTIEDLYRFERAMAENKLLKPETVAEAYTGGSHEKACSRNYGFGWRLTEAADGNKIIYHNGWWHGYNSVFMRRPKDQTTIIVLCNKYNTNTYHVKGVWEILDGKGAGLDESGE
jgi:CubicO group peptidase (beta-lactamase class C family)